MRMNPARKTLAYMLSESVGGGSVEEYLHQADFLIEHQSEWMPEVLAQVAALENWDADSIRELAEPPDPEPGVRECARTLAVALRRRTSSRR